MLGGLSMLALAGCRQPNVDDDSEILDPDPDLPPSNGEGDGDEPVEEEPLCDLSQFPSVDPVWLDLTAANAKDAMPSVLELVVTDDAIFAGGSHDVGEILGPGFYERRTLDGALVWRVELDTIDHPMVAAWDGTHLYGAYGSTLQRWSGDGIADDWVIQIDGTIEDVAINADSVALTGSILEAGLDPSSNTNAFFVVASKSAPPTFAIDADLGEDGPNDKGQAIGWTPWGGWSVGGYRSYPGAQHRVWLANQVDGGMTRRDLEIERYAHVMDIFGHSEGTLLVGRDYYSPPLWLVAFDQAGAELWWTSRHPCGDAEAGVYEAAMADDRLFLLGAVRNGPATLAPILVTLEVDGSLVSTEAIHVEGDHASLETLAVTEDGVYVGGAIVEDNRFYRVIGRANR